ncbi:HNH endonuclease [Aeromicrobium phragmitis]|uniref:HNH endonuclease n=1 Tax=Aeromicrobium phragmitis TaxID=2478914 RepID=A0A3L8PN94_9ACTN|nr:HNH endonuclease family protein [Aeromicrobium phragmitis]RLV56153.1 HNH endonuclease [Aeromicrobium phragmitis]
MKRVLTGVASVVVVLAVVLGWTGDEFLARSQPAPAPEARASVALAESLPVKGRAAKTGYSREQFGEAWTDAADVEFGRNGCDTRNDILRRDLTDVEFGDDRGCRVLSGTLDDPFTGERIEFRRGERTSSAVQIDHLVALSDAWQKGAQQWTREKRIAFANDPINLLAVDGAANSAKGDADVATWLPANRAYRCTYVSKIVNVKAAYGVWVTQAEADAMRRELQRC